MHMCVYIYIYIYAYICLYIYIYIYKNIRVVCGGCEADGEALWLGSYIHKCIYTHLGVAMVAYNTIKSISKSRDPGHRYIHTYIHVGFGRSI